jgi:peptidoglycan/LPS O-acetylase OafA/YrhL
VCFFENLDGLRFLSFLSVFFFHIFQSDKYPTLNFLFKNGKLGVNFFFVLSGFLITYLLIIEKNDIKINVFKFWIRRALRIWPLYFLCVALGFLISPILFNCYGIQLAETAELPYFLTFLANFNVIKMDYLNLKYYLFCGA